MESLGIRYYSKSPGIKGVIKKEPADFIVEEITPEGILLEVDKNVEVPSVEGGEYTTFTLQKTNWEDIGAVREVARRVHVSRKRFKFAGTKDKNAVTTQRVSAWKVPKENLEKVNIKDIVVRDFAISDQPCNLGTLKGNRFTLRIRDAEGGREEVETVVKELDGRIPNYFGWQRFGNREVTHEVGKAILRKDFKEAVRLYLCKPGDRDEESARVRAELAETWDLKKALQTFPRYMRYEKGMMNHLVKNETDYIGAMRKLSKRLRWMFVHAYQSYVFNIALSGHIENGDVPEKLPLVGSKSELDEISARVMKDDGLDKDSFVVKEMPELSSEGEVRDTFINFEGFEVLDEIGDDIVLRFTLPKGCYATILLNEIMKV